MPLIQDVAFLSSLPRITVFRAESVPGADKNLKLPSAAGVSGEEI